MNDLINTLNVQRCNCYNNIQTRAVDVDTKCTLKFLCYGNRSCVLSSNLHQLM